MLPHGLGILYLVLVSLPRSESHVLLDLLGQCAIFKDGGVRQQGDEQDQREAVDRTPAELYLLEFILNHSLS